jgi:hypothetical protein
LAELRELVLLRRIARAAESQADALNRIALVAEGWWAESHHVRPSRRAEFEVGRMDVAAVNERYLKQLEAEELGMTLEELEDDTRAKEG